LKINKQISRKKSASIQAVGGYMNTIAMLIQGLLLMPLYLHFIESHVFGLWLATGGILGLLSMMNLGLSSMMMQRIAYAYAKNNVTSINKYFTNGFLVYSIISLLLLLIGLTLSPLVPNIIGATSNNGELLKGCFQLSLISLVLSLINESLRCLSYATLRPLIPVTGVVFGRLSGMILTIFLLYRSYGLWSIPIGMVIGEVIIFIFNLVSSLKVIYQINFKLSFNIQVIKEYFKTAPSLFMATIGNTVANTVEPLLITIFISPEVTTIYILNRRAADVVFNMLSVIVGSISGPLSNLIGEGNVHNIANIVIKILFACFALSIIGFAIYQATNEMFISLWVGKEFVTDQRIVMLIALAFSARFFRGVISQLLYSYGDFTFPSKLIFAEGLVRIILSALLINYLGLIAIPLCLLLMASVMSFLLGFRLKKHLQLEFNPFVIMRFFIVALFIFILSYILQANLNVIGSWGLFIFNLILVSISIVLLFFLSNINLCRRFFKGFIK
jgi:O-antigen/teichoic acid export membrane protein